MWAPPVRECEKGPDMKIEVGGSRLRLNLPVGSLSGQLKWLEDDLVAQGLELSDRAGLSFGWCLPGEVVGSGVFVEFAGGEHVPGSGEIATRALDGPRRAERRPYFAEK